MLTLRTLKELIDTPKRGEKLPTPKQLRTGESPIVAHKTTGAGVNEVHIIVYQSGYAVYGIGNRATVFPVNLELGYGYSSVTEKKRKESGPNGPIRNRFPWHCGRDVPRQPNRHSS